MQINFAHLETGQYKNSLLPLRIWRLASTTTVAPKTVCGQKGARKNIDAWRFLGSINMWSQFSDLIFGLVGVEVTCMALILFVWCCGQSTLNHLLEWIPIAHAIL